MKRKSYLRGLGLGILMTSLVFILVEPSEMSDKEIIERAKELGYTKVEEDSALGLKELLETGTPAPTNAPDISPSIVPTPTKEPTLSPTIKPEPTLTPVPTKEPTGTPVATVTPTVVPTKTPEPTITPTRKPEPEVITAVIDIERGNTATTVCNKIEEAGIVEDGMKLRTYLVNHNLTDYINIGRYTLSSDMTLEEIAGIITGR